MNFDALSYILGMQTASTQWGEIVGTLSNQSDLNSALTTIGNRITNLQNIGRFLALWNSATGLPLTEPTTTPYAYKTGDYFRISNFDNAADYASYSTSRTYNIGDKCKRSGNYYICNTDGTTGAWDSTKWTQHTITNYMPNGASYTGAASTTVFTGSSLAVGAIFYYDGTAWALQPFGGGGTVGDVQVNGSSILQGGIANITSSMFPATFKFTVTDTGEGYTTTATSDQILAAIQAGKMPICCHAHPQGGDLELLLKTYDSYSATFVGLFMLNNVLTQMQILIYGSVVGTVESYRMYDWGGSIASTFNYMWDYNVGDYVIYGDASSAYLCKCIAAYTPPAEPTEDPPPANFTIVTVMSEVKNKFGRDGATTLDATLVSGKQYQLGDKSATFNMVLPATASYNDFIEVIFKATAAFTPTSSGGTVVGDTLPTTVANKTYDILYTWTGTNWLCQYLYW